MAEHIHSVYDTDTHFTVDPITRQAKNDGSKKVNIVRDDHNSEVYTFELPRFVEGHDMTTCNQVEVHYLNTHATTKETSAGKYRAADFGLSATDPEKVTFSWVISCNATKFPGSLAFSLHFACVDNDTDEVVYWWSSATNTSTTVLDSINNNEESDGGEVSDLQDKTVTPTQEMQVIRPDGEYRALAKVLVEPIPPEYIIPTGTLFVDANGDYEIRDFDKITVNVPPKLQDKTITFNGAYTPSVGYDGFSQVVVDVADVPAVLQEKTVYPTTTAQSVEPDEGFDGLSSVTVESMRLQSRTVDQNGEVIPDRGFDGLSSVTVQVEPRLQELEITKNGEYVAEGGYDGLSTVKVKVESTGAEYTEGTGVSISDENVISVEIDDETITVNDEGELQAVTSTFNGAIVVQEADAKYLLHEYTLVDYVAGNKVVYGGMGASFITQGYVVVAPPEIWDSASADDFSHLSKYMHTSLPSGFIYSGNNKIYDQIRLVMSAMNTTSTTYKLEFYDSTTETTGDIVTVITYDNDFIGFCFVYDHIITPNEVINGVTFTHGGVACYLYTFQKVNALAAPYSLRGGTSTLSIPFASEAEYNLAVGLTYEPITLQEVQDNTTEV